MNTMEMTRTNSGFLPSFFRGFEDDLFNRQPAITSKIAVNIRERENDFLVEMAAPGFKKEDIHIEVDGSKLTIRGEATEKKENSENENYTYREFSYNEFTRSFTLPKNVDSNKIEADYSDGILQVIVPKPETQKKIVKTIELK